MSQRAAAQLFTYEKFSARDGLLADKLESVYQDKTGFLWIGSEIGINRYDGYTFEPYLFAGDKQIETISAFIEDRHGNFWAGGERGLFCYRQNNFQPVRFANGNPLVYQFHSDPAGNLWLCTNHGLYTLVPDDLARFSRGEIDSFNLSPFLGVDDEVFSVDVLPSGVVFFGNERGLNKYKPGDATWTRIWASPPRLSVKSIAAADEFNVLWTSHTSLPWQMKDGVIRQFDQPRFLSDRIKRKGSGYYFLSHNNLLHYEHGVFKYLFPHTDEDILFTSDFTEDQEGNIWVATWSGLFKYRPSPFRIMPPLDPYGEDCYSVLETRDGSVYVGGNHGMLFQYKDGSFEKLFAPGDLFRNAELFALHEDHKGDLWIGSGYEGIATVRDNRKLHTYRQEDGTSENTFYFFYQPDSTKLWAGTQNAITEFDLTQDPPVPHVVPFAENKSNLSELYGCLEAGGETWFFGSQGIFRLVNGELSGDSILGLDKRAINVRSAVTANDGSIWMGTQGFGLLKCEMTNGRLNLLKRFTRADGLQSDVILDLQLDANGNLWLSDYSGLTLATGLSATPVFYTFDHHDGTMRQTFKDQWLYAQRNGTLWVFNSVGTYTFHPDSMRYNTRKPSVHMRDVLLFEGREDIAGYAVGDSYELPYSRNILSFQYTGVSLSNPAKNQYRYKLDGLDADWTTTSSRRVSYAGLPPGHYTFLVNAANNHGVWADAPASLRFVINPPFWQTMWFYVLSGLVVISGVVGFFRYRVSTIRKKEREKTRINQMMAELENKALRAQINPHFIFNSLNAIQECIVTEKTDVAYQYLTTFSRLLRMVLNYAERNTVPLSIELTLLRHYLELESLRFNQSFHYEIKTDPQIVPEQLLVPNMITQPFIENAIWHGLLHKEDDKQLTIHYAREGDKIICSIEDNGIGRQRSALIRQQQIQYDRRESKGISITERRIEALNTMQVKVAFSIKDLVDNEGDPCGTVVQIEFPVKENAV
ncbi:MAG: histidine kinase [Bacteroidia bacterium]|nr:histidine kinase [Bacteroidia bacterium]